MKYFVAEREEMKDGTMPSAMTPNDTYAAAYGQYHSTLASAMVNDNCISCECMLLDENFVTKAKEGFNKYDLGILERPTEAVEQ